MSRFVLLLLAAASLIACTGEQDEVQPVAVKAELAAELDPVDGIDWFDGTVDEAFAAAKESDKPIYLYWGAVWCPPCHAISATVFKSPEFIERSRLFIPVYLDGDNMQAYANILDLTLSNSSSTSELVTSLMASDVALSAEDCTLLAYNSWGQDTTILAEYDEAEAFLRMYAACPSDLGAERSILYFSWLDKVLNAEDDDGNPVPLSDEQRQQALKQFESVLAEPEMVRANIFVVLLSGADIIAAVTEAGSAERDALASRYYTVLDALAADESVYKRERIYTLSGKIGLERIDDAEAGISESLQQQIRDMTKWADESTPSVYERQPIVNALANVLDEAGMDDVAKPLLVAELERSKQPYYFMPSIADIEQRAGNDEAAIEWLQKAYDSTRGPATRFQWGYYYLTGLLEMAPTDVERIHATTIGLLAELQRSNAFHQRPKAQLLRLENNLIEWGDDNGKQSALLEIRESVLDICGRVPAEDTARETCEAFLESV
jgi:thiol-disulfide isomerase/thioredoxin